MYKNLKSLSNPLGHPQSKIFDLWYFFRRGYSPFLFDILSGFSPPNPDNMHRTCSVLFFLANITAFITSIPLLAMAWLMMTSNQSHCDHQMYPQLLEIGAFLFITSLLGMIGLCYRVKSLLWIFFVLVAIRIVLHVVLTTMAVVSIHNQKAFNNDYSSGEEYKVEHFSGIAGNYVDGFKWEARRSCVIRLDSCRGYDSFRSSMSPKVFMRKYPLKWGCCQPPQSCGYRYEGEMTWVVPETGIHSNNTDCFKYMNNKDVLCSNCETCKAGFLAFMYGYLFKLAITDSIILGVFLFMIIADVMAIKDIGRTDEKF